MPLRSFPVQMCAVAACCSMWTASAQAKKVLIIKDPNTATSSSTLLEKAVAEIITRQTNQQVVTAGPISEGEARVQQWLEQGQNLRDLGQRDFEQLELDAALRKYNKSFNKFDRAAAAGADLTPIRETLAMISAIYLLLGQERRARGFIERLLALDIDFKPDEAVFNPNMLKSFDAIANRYRNGPTFKVRIDVDPAGAAVMFDSHLIGVAPVTVEDVRKGRHYVTASLKGFETDGKALEVRSRLGRELSLALSETPRDTEFVEAATAAISAIDEDELPPEASALASTADANSIILLASREGSNTLVYYEADGSGRFSRSVTGVFSDAGSASRAAEQLLAPLTGHAKTTVAAEDGSAGGGDIQESPGGNTTSSGEVGGSGTPSTSYFLSPNPTKEWVLLGTYGGAVGAGVVGGVFGILALSSRNEYYQRSTVSSGPSQGQLDHAATTDQIEGEAVASRVHRNAIIADILYGVAIAAAVTGVCLHFLWEPEGENATLESPTDSPTGDEPTTKDTDGWGVSIGPAWLQVTF